MSKRGDHVKGDRESSSHYKKPAEHGHPKGSEVDAPRVEKPSDDQQWKAEQRVFQDRQLCLAKWLNWITAGAAMVGLLGLAFLYGTLEATRIAANAAKDTAAETRRLNDLTERETVPKIVIEARPDYVPGLVPDKEFSIPVRFTNIGKHSASNVTIASFFDIAPANRMGPPPPGHGGWPVTYLGVDRIAQIRHNDPWDVTIPMKPLSAEAVGRVASLQASLRVQGTISYDDATLKDPPRRSQTFCFVYHATDKWIGRRGFISIPGKFCQQVTEHYSHENY